MQNHILKALMLLTFGLVMVGLTACSEVRFSPGEESISKEDIDGPPPICERDQNGGSCEPPVACESTNTCEVPTEKVTDNFLQQGTGAKVDILFVVDNSPSMYVEQQKLGQRIQSFLSMIDNINWQIGITTTDVTNGQYGLKGSLLRMEGTQSYILNKNFPNYEQIFLATVTREESDCFVSCASSDEQPLEATRLAIDKRNTDNQFFFRNDADLAVVYLSDEDEMSTGESSQATTPSLVSSSVRLAFGNAKVFTSYGIVVKPGDQDCLDSAGGGAYHYYGTFVAQLTANTGGVLGSICDNDYGPNLRSIGERVRELADRVELSQKPERGSVVLRLTPHQNISFRVEGKFVLFDTPPKVGTEIEVDYLIKKKVEDPVDDTDDVNADSDRDEDDDDEDEESDD